MSTFDWMDRDAPLSCAEEIRLTLRDQYTAKRAKRKLLDARADMLLQQLHELYQERDSLSDDEDRLLEQLRRK